MKTTDRQTQIINLLQVKPCTSKELVNASGMTYSHVMNVIYQLERKRRVVRRPLPNSKKEFLWELDPDYQEHATPPPTYTINFGDLEGSLAEFMISLQEATEKKHDFGFFVNDIYLSIAALAYCRMNYNPLRFNDVEELFKEALHQFERFKHRVEVLMHLFDSLRSPAIDAQAFIKWFDIETREEMMSILEYQTKVLLDKHNKTL